MSTHSNRALLVTDSRFTLHDPRNHPEQPERMHAILRALEQHNLLNNRLPIPLQPVSEDVLFLVHTREHIDRLRKLTASGGGWIDSDTWCGPESLELAMLAAGGACSAIDALMDGVARRGFVIARPPGHHAPSDRAMGFCLLNTVALAAEQAIANGAQRVAILDWDVHHGNGTQDIFYRRSDVLYCSMHQHPWYPGSGLASERGVDDGAGFTVNAPYPAGTNGAHIREIMTQQMMPAIRAFAPDALLISAGFDAHQADPLSLTDLTDDDFTWLARSACSLADEISDGRLLLVLEGGYDCDVLARNVVNTIRVLDS